ncbi:MAG TPA: DUF4097 family beta strand repeat-containing protein [Candidatus Dormibacteraeota bacterium]|nr:DUF4097 family beta strand repeat-containing protein [Candidatus Dormibacteraeota bacterium]
MKDLQREILSQVAAGKISAAEGAARLESLDSAGTPPPVEAPAAPSVTRAAASDTRRIKVISQVGSAEIVGDPSVAFVVADGPHSARQDGDTMVICQAPFEETDHFTFGRGERRPVVNGVEFHRRKLTVRMNPKLALCASVQAGSVRIEGVQGPIEGEVQAGNCQVSGFRGPLNFVIQMGNLSASGQLDSGESKVRCEMGSVKIHLEKGSSVRVTARTTLGKVSIEGEGTENVNLGHSGKDVTVGSGAGSLDIECTMGNVRVSAE